MKTMTCKQLGGACDLEFHAETFEEVAAQSKAHGTEMYKVSEADHLAVMSEMRELMTDPKAMADWMDSKRAEFDALPHNT